MKAALYVRVSTAEQSLKGYSIGEQTERLSKYADAMGWEVFKVYTDPGYSGSNTDRPALQELIADASAGMFKKVVVYKLDRLSRSQRDTLALIEDVFNRNSVDFVSMSENFDTSTPFGRATIGILAVFAQLEREQIKERMMMGKSARSKTGAWMGTHKPPIGYDLVGGKLTPNPHEMELVKQIYTLFLSGHPMRQIARDMNASGLYHHYGKWSEMTVKKVLSNREYIGEICYQRNYLPGIHEPIVSEDDFIRAQEMLAEVHRRYNADLRPGRAKSYLGGLLYCAQCGGKYHKLTTKGYSYYICASRSKKCDAMVKDHGCKNKTWRMDQLDEMILDEIRGLQFDPEFKPEAEKPVDVSRQIEGINRQIARYMDLYALEKIPLDVLENKINALTADRERLAEEKRPVRGVPVKNFAEVIKYGSFDDIRAVLLALIERIEIDGEDITVYWNFAIE